jgi:hypothetical protein
MMSWTWFRMDSGNTMSDSRVGVKLVVVEVVVVIVFAPKSLYVGKTHFYVHGDKRIRGEVLFLFSFVEAVVLACTFSRGCVLP